MFKAKNKQLDPQNKTESETHSHIDSHLINDKEEKAKYLAKNSLFST